jgi:hypothetical protein
MDEIESLVTHADLATDSGHTVGRQIATTRE